MADLIHGFTTICGSGVMRKGRYLELMDPDSGDEAAEIFLPGEGEAMQISLFKQGLALDVEEAK